MTSALPVGPATDPAPQAQPEEPVLSAPPRPLTEAARRALAEAEARRAALDAHAAEIAARREKDGRGGLEPVRYGDWEVKGLASDF